MVISLPHVIVGTVKLIDSNAVGARISPTARPYCEMTLIKEIPTNRG